MNASPILLQMKYARVVSLFSRQTGISLDEALSFFYHSDLYQLVKNGVSLLCYPHRLPACNIRRFMVVWRYENERESRWED